MSRICAATGVILLLSQPGAEAQGIDIVDVAGVVIDKVSAVGTLHGGERVEAQDDPASWLAKGLQYASHPDQPADSKQYLEGSADPVASWTGGKDWEAWLTGAMQSLPQTGVEVDDHQGTPIGEGDSIGLVAAQVTMDDAMISLLPSDFQTGLLASCGGQCNSWPAAVRVSHTKAAGLDLMRISLKIGTDNLGSVDMHFTETLKIFPIAYKSQLEAFSYGVKYGNGWAAAKYPVQMAELASNANKASSKWGAETKLYGSLGKDFYSMTPYMIGGGDGRVAGAMKWRLTPAGDRWEFPPEQDGLDVKQRMRAQLLRLLPQGDMAFRLEIQVATDPNVHPLNDASQEWDESTAPWIPMGLVRVPKQDFPEGASVGTAVGSGLWEGTGAPVFNSKEFLFAPGSTPHRPLGDINYFRADLYPSYDQARQEYLLQKPGGAAAKCPFASIAQWLR